MAVAGHDLHGRDDRDRTAYHVWPEVAGRKKVAQVRFSEHLQEPCSFQIAWNGCKSNGFL